MVSSRLKPPPPPPIGHCVQDRYCELNEINDGDEKKKNLI